MARSGSVVSRASKYAVVVGAVLIAINHGDAVLRGDLAAGRLWRMGLTVLVPYVVSTLSSVGAMRQMSRGRPPADGRLQPTTPNPGEPGARD
jgi:hypothetical protein